MNIQPLYPVVSTARVGDLLLWSNPGEAFPQMHFRMRDGTDASVVFPIGSANDFLGYMTGDDDAYAQAFLNGAGWIAGCPDRALRELLGLEDRCNDHWGLMTSPSMGVHVVCTAQEAAARLGFAVDPASRQPVCPLLVATDQAERDVLPPP
jgi:dihydrodipicolinate synthase/N-acetylneuraminate lyase